MRSANHWPCIQNEPPSEKKSVSRSARLPKIAAAASALYSSWLTTRSGCNEPIRRRTVVVGQAEVHKRPSLGGDRSGAGAIGHEVNLHIRPERPNFANDTEIGNRVSTAPAAAEEGDRRAASFKVGEGHNSGCHHAAVADSGLTGTAATSDCQASRQAQRIDRTRLAVSRISASGTAIRAVRKFTP